MPIGKLTFCWKIFPEKTTKMLFTRNSSMFIMSFLVYLLFKSVFLHKRGLFTTQYQIFVSMTTIFVNEGVSYGSCESAFKFRERNGCV